MPAGRPRLQEGNLPSICLESPDPLRMTGWFRVWMANHFGSSATIENPVLQNFVWNADPKQTQIAIESSSSWNPQVVEFRPSIIIKRGGWQNLKFGINNRMMGNIPGKPGITAYANYWQGSHTLFVCAGEDGECELLAREVFRELNQNGQRLQTLLGMFKFAVTEVGEMGKLEEASENFVVPINVAYVLEEAWFIEDEGPLIKKLDLAMLTP